MAKKAQPIGSCLSTLLDDSNRMLPFMSTILYNLESRAPSSHYLRHMITTLATGRSSKNVHILCLENAVNPSKFINRLNVDLCENINVLDIGDDLSISVFDKLPNLITVGNRTDNVLVIDSLHPLLFTSPLDHDKTVHNLILGLRKLQSTFAYIVINHQTDINVYDKSLELSLKQISNALLDFRRESGIDSGATCQLVDSSIHVHITTKKKHPRTHLKVSSQHEHFDVHPQTFKIIKYHSGPQVRKTILAKLQPEVQNNIQESSIDKLVPFSLSLKECEQKAKDELVLPYMRKQEPEAQGTVKSVLDSTTSPSTAKSVPSTGQVIYHYDKFDDFDEDDPDDDLDF